MCFVKQTQGLEERQEISTEKATEILFYISDQILGNMRRDTDTCNRRFKHRPEEELKATNFLNLPKNILNEAKEESPKK